jgi:hypothetical protein
MLGFGFATTGGTCAGGAADGRGGAMLTGFSGGSEPGAIDAGLEGGGTDVRVPPAGMR